MQTQLRQFLAPLLLASALVHPAIADNGGSNQTRLRTNLTGAAIQGKTPEGHAEFRMDGTRTRLTIEVENVNLPASTVLTVSIMRGARSTDIGMITLSAGAEAELELESDHVAVVTAVQKGDIITVSNEGAAILVGVF
jgi:hypothetical protein